ncbi:MULTISPECIES: quinohemoprotein amine dehydrogenase subunit alpha [unclassified Halomonas]|uniref:quinohemoprotein amine dehydrogenase subunit alpha n=1 Tax=unclassified Halomonas TaxID=2609666 RepID=UPI002884DE10|nr:MULTISPECIES: quinohemoprotein amine dehydrogenase subunit alpha [unclassified Halomonas]MDT0502530.1 quinohemoprotein amine dehydrogenase subunit alpha [Halomonas sp. PAR7]MDT0512762.1 quinohemoprotein amine dehydrogenase subunit alpha [Halomonas sp. LES1]MDT0591920.1 quinohemoprotein amine dehydrogenase subunit alpha [Halomonas sp. PAR8]
MTRHISLAGWLGKRAMVTLLVGLSASPVFAEEGVEILRERCAACHTETTTAEESAYFSRISDQRKTPEGWQMTINRMIHLRGIEIPEEEKRSLVQYLADTQGLAPDETEGFRYLLEQDNNRVEAGIDPDLEQMCARCHSAARVGLQRRTEQEWQYLVNFHMGQFPTTELHAMARDREWYRLAHDELAPELAERYGLKSEAWEEWLSQEKPLLNGSWRVLGFIPGKGEYDGRMTATPDEDGNGFMLQMKGRYADGSPLEGEGHARVFTGYEWRGTLMLDDVEMRQVLAADAEGETLRGRMFLADSRRLGGEMNAYKDHGGAEILGIQPGYLRLGDSGEVTLIGQHLSGEVSLGEGVRVEEVLERSDDRIRMRISAAPEGSPGARDVTVGEATGDSILAVYDCLARLEVEPTNALARVGGNGGQLDKMRVAFRAVGYAAGADGEVGTDDDLRLGYMPADWSIIPADEAAAHEQDAEYAGTIDAHGIFTPGDAGPNPERPKSANNVGRLKAVATVDDGTDQLSGESRLLVAVQDYVQRVLD